MTGRFPPSTTIDYTEGTDESPTSYPSLDESLEQAISVSERALGAYDRPAVLWTGGKDSTLTLYIILQVADEHGFDRPPAVFIDHFQHFESIHGFVDRWADRWGIDVLVTGNDEIDALADHPGDRIAVDDLGPENRRHVEEILEYDGDNFRFLLDTYVGNHLLKTVPLNAVIERDGFDAIISGVRWDEQAARADETFFSP